MVYGQKFDVRIFSEVFKDSSNLCSLKRFHETALHYKSIEKELKGKKKKEVNRILGEPERNYKDKPKGRVYQKANRRWIYPLSCYPDGTPNMGETGDFLIIYFKRNKVFEVSI